jgi:hypothetical protein
MDLRSQLRKASPKKGSPNAPNRTNVLLRARLGVFEICLHIKNNHKDLLEFFLLVIEYHEFSKKQDWFIR